tara:strand:+ start:1875 stop:2087 length:213 start_codon:yes stop_codon:yes gene_type:complete
MINTDKLFKYVIMFVVVTLSAYTIPTCGVMQKHAVYVGLIASSTYAMIDKCYPHYIIRKDNNDGFIKEIY